MSSGEHIGSACTRTSRTMARRRWCNARRQLTMRHGGRGEVDMTGGGRLARSCVGASPDWRGGPEGQRARGPEDGCIEAGVSGHSQHEDDSPHPAKRPTSLLWAWHETATRRHGNLGRAQLAQPQLSAVMHADKANPISTSEASTLDCHPPPRTHHVARRQLQPCAAPMT